MKISDFINKATIKTSKGALKKIIESNNLVKKAPNSTRPDINKSFKALTKSEIFKSNFAPVYKESNANVFLLAKAKAECVDALKSYTPYEKIILLNEKSNTVLSEINGDAKACEIASSILNKAEENTIALHGHPAFISDISAPVSFEDFKLINNCKLKKIIAYNKNGEFSLLEKTPLYKKLSSSEFRKLESKYFVSLFNHLPKQSKTIGQEYIEKYKKTGDKKNLLDLISIINEFQLTKEGTKATHAFWQNHAQEANLMYKTNYNFNF